jgi:hypothetical protein
VSPQHQQGMQHIRPSSALCDCKVSSYLWHGFASSSLLMLRWCHGTAGATLDLQGG